MAWAAAAVLGAQGAGISLSSDGTLRMPWGASCDDAAATERLQFTTGEGPCLTAHAENEPVLANAEVIARSWPIFADQLHRHTPYRSVFAAPLHSAGAMDLYFIDPQGCTDLNIEAALTITGQIFTAMIDEQVVSLLNAHPAVRIPSMARRTEVAVAMGMLTVALQVTYTDALSVLRAHAFATDRGVDEVAADLVSGALAPDQLTA